MDINLSRWGQLIMPEVDLRLCEIALDECDTASFEKFAQAMHAAILGTSFVPLGGYHDGGADGYEDPIFTSSARHETFMQASKTPSVSAKVRHTIKRLREFGRDPKQVTFYFSSAIPNTDIFEEELTDDLGVSVRIRGKQYIVVNVNSSPAAQAAYNSYLSDAPLYLTKLGSVGLQRSYPFDARTLCAFLSQEVEQRRSRTNLLTTVTDSLILWALEGTDPDKKLVLSRDAILEKVTSAIPTVKAFINGEIDNRLQHLSQKANDSGREILWHSKLSGYALRHSERQRVAQENIEDAYLKARVSDGLKGRYLQAFTSDAEQKLVNVVVDLIHKIVEEVFEQQGAALGSLLLDTSVDDSTIVDARDIILRRLDSAPRLIPLRQQLEFWLTKTVHKLLHKGTEAEVSYLRRLSQTYFLLFTLKNDPKLVEFFNRMGGDLRLYIGSDMLITALTEGHLEPQYRDVTNALRIISDAGATLILAEPALDEVYANLNAADLEFKNHYADVEMYVNEDFAWEIERPFIQAYFFARLELPGNIDRPRGWRSYVNEFCEPSGLQSGSSKDGFRKYLCQRFLLQFEDREEMERNLELSNVEGLTQAILNQVDKTRPQAEVLARNDALHVLRVLDARKSGGENKDINPFGGRTWWLTHESKVRRAAAIFFSGKHRPTVMRPEFILNYIALTPTKNQVADSYKNIFPTSLGIELGRRISERDLQRALRAVREAAEVDEDRAKVMVAELSDRLKIDHLREYHAI